MKLAQSEEEAGFDPLTEDELDEQGNPTEDDDDGDDSFGNAVEDEDEMGNPVGTEYDDDGNVVEYEETPPEPASPRPLPAPLFGLTAEQREALEDRFTPDQIDGILMIAGNLNAQAQQANVYANSVVEAAFSDATPEYRAHVMPRVNAWMAKMPPEMRSKPNAAETATLLSMEEERESTGETLSQIMARYVGMQQGARPAVKSRAVPVVRPPASRSPAPTNGGSGALVRGNRAERVSKSVQTIMKMYGVTQREAEDISRI